MSQYNTQTFQNNYGPRTTRRKSLLIGINYEGQKSALRGCRQDVRNMVHPTRNLARTSLPQYAEIFLVPIPHVSRLPYR